MQAHSQYHQLFTPSAIILDMDGLMIDSEPLWFEVERAFCLSRGYEWTSEHAARCTGRGIAMVLAEMSALFGFAVDIKTDSDTIIDAFISRVAELQLKPGCAELIEEAGKHDIPLAVASSSPLRLVRAALDHFELTPRFRTIVSGESVARLKPAPDIFLHAARELDELPARSLVLEDSLAGATAGRAAGMYVIAVPEGDFERRDFEAVADLIAGDLFEARRALKFPELASP